MSKGANEGAGGVGFDPAATTGSGSGGNTGGSGGGNSAPPATGSAGGSGNTPTFLDTISDAELRGFAEQRGWKDGSALVKSYRELEAKMSSGESAKAPANPSDYQFSTPQDANNIGYNDEFAGWYRNAAHKADVPKDVAAKLHDEFVEFARGSAGMQAEAMQQRISQAQEQLTKEWGAPDSPNFQRNMEMARRAVRMSDEGLMDELRAAGVLTKNAEGQDVVANPAIFKAFAKMGAEMYAEDSVYGDPAADKNPFADGTEDVTAQGRLIKTDPQKAANLIMAAGKQLMFKDFLARMRGA